jgi:hypothetical protein
VKEVIVEVVVGCVAACCLPSAWCWSLCHVRVIVRYPALSSDLGFVGIKGEEADREDAARNSWVGSMHTGERARYVRDLCR